MGMSCIVIATEQHAFADHVIWKRFARVIGDIEAQSANDMQWFENIPKLIFDKDNFIQVFTRMNIEIVERYHYCERNIDLQFPSKPPK